MELQISERWKCSRAKLHDTAYVDVIVSVYHEWLMLTLPEWERANSFDESAKFLVSQKANNKYATTPLTLPLEGQFN